MLEDPFNEFIVRENKSLNKESLEKDFNDQQWLERFTCREEMVPIFLSKHKDKVLHSGKYLNVIREYGLIDFKYPWPEHETMLVAGSRFTHKAASQQHNQGGEDEEMKGDEPEPVRAAVSSSQQFHFFEPIERAYEWSSQ